MWWLLELQQLRQPQVVRHLERADMTQSFIHWGEALSRQKQENLNPGIQQVILACQNHPDIEFIELREDDEDCVLIVIDVNDGTFDVPNDIGIRRTERLALRFQPDQEYPWGVFALRSDFPLTIHQNQTLVGQPRSLCIYAQAWANVERTWTPENFLMRILWWLRSTVEGTIHPDDQPLEELFFTSPYHIVLPPDLFSKDGQTLYEISISPVPVLGRRRTFIGEYASSDAHGSGPTCLPIFVPLSPVSNGVIEDCPVDLGQLQERVTSRGSDLLGPLKAAVRGYIGDGRQINAEQNALVLIITVTPRERNDEVERFDLHGFCTEKHIGTFAEALGVAYKTPIEQDKWYPLTLVDGSEQESFEWSNMAILPVSVSQFPRRSQIHAYSGIQEVNSELQCMLAGAGALGSALAQIWERECWGYWHYVDDDVVKPHNLARHIATRDTVGFSKSLVVDTFSKNLHCPPSPGKPQNHNHFACSILSDNTTLKAEISKKDLLVDATTTLYVPRELAKRDCPRVATVFLTPSGLASVLLLENKGRTMRANHLEAQYYRGIIESDWGSTHLDKNLSSLWVGAGCREATVALPYELVMTHAASLARQVRFLVNEDQAAIGIWTLDENTGSIRADLLKLASPRHAQIGDWQVVWDADIEAKLSDLRNRSLPSETGGILLGFVDQKDRTITIVAATTEPEGSMGSEASFSRSSAEELRQAAYTRTAGIVNYIGEWHSHPRGCSPMPSHADIYQLAYIGNTMLTEGQPALMVIVSDGRVGISVLSESGDKKSIIYVDTLGQNKH